MAVIQLLEPISAVEQLAIFNRNIGGNLKRSVNYSVPAGTSWAIFSAVLTNPTMPADITSTVDPALAALSEVTSTESDQFFGQVPSQVQPADHEFVVFVDGRETVEIGITHPFSQSNRFQGTFKPPINRKWALFGLVTPSALTDGSISLLETAMETVGAIDIADHLLDGTVSARASANASITISAHLRLEPIPL